MVGLLGVCFGGGGNTRIWELGVSTKIPEWMRLFWYRIY